MLKAAPDHLDADLVLKIYDLRREEVMRESRNAINRDYWPRNAEEALAVLRADHPLNRAWRQVTGYWEMVYGMARHGIINGDFLVENNTEGLFLLARVEAWLDDLRKTGNPRLFRNSEWIGQETEAGRGLMAYYRARVATTLVAR